MPPARAASALPPTDVSDGGGGGARGRLGGGVLAKLACTSACVWEAGDHYVVAAHVTDVEHAEHLPRERVEAAARGARARHATPPAHLLQPWVCKAGASERRQPRTVAGIGCAAPARRGGGGRQGVPPEWHGDCGGSEPY